MLLSGCKKENWLDWKAENMAWLEHNANVQRHQENFKITPNGLQYLIIDDGKGGPQQHPDVLKTVIVNYTKRLINGNVVEQGQNVPLTVSGQIAGIIEGLCKMVPTAHYVLYIPSNLGYGSGSYGTEGVSGFIPPYSTIIYDVELLVVE